jgi:hypothetical protein
MAILNLTQEEYQKWLKDHPDQDHTILNGKGETQKYVNGDYGLLGNLTRQSVQPFFNAGRIVNNAIDPNSNSVTGEERANPARFLAQTGAGIGSYLVPGGASTLLGAGVRGAATGALANFGGQDLSHPDDANALLTGSLFGGILGAGTHALTNGIKLPKVGGNLEGLEETGLKTRFGKTGIKAADVGGIEERNAIYKTLDQELPKTGTNTQIAEGITNALDKRGREVQNVLAQSTDRFNTSKIYDKITNELRHTNLADSEAGKQIFSMIEELPRDASAAEVDALRRAIDKIIPDRAFQGSTEELANTTRVLRTARNVISEELKNAPGLAQYEPLLTTESNLIKANDAVLKAVDKNRNIRSPFLSGLSVPGSGDVLDTIGNQAGKIMQKVGEVGGEVSGQTNGLVKPGFLSSILQNPAVEGQIVNALTPSTAGNQIGTEVPGGGSGRGGVTQPPIQPQYSTNSQDNSRQLAITLLNKGHKPSDVKSIIDLLYPDKGGSKGGKVLPANQLKDLADVKSSIFELGNLQGVFNENQGSFDPVSGALREANPLRGYDKAYTNVDSIITRVRQIIGKGLEGGVLRKEDENKYEKILPNIKDTPDVVQRKLDGLNDLLNAKYQGYVGTFQEGGYDPFAGGL